MHLRTVVAPAYPAVSVATAYEFLRWDVELAGSPAEPFYPAQTTLEIQIAAATDFVERHARVSLVPRTLCVMYPDFAFPDAAYWRRIGDFDVVEGGGDWLELPRPPAIEVLSVQYRDPATNALVALDPSSYFVSDGLVPRLQFVSGFTPPGVAVSEDSVQITYRAGYEPAGSPTPTDAASYSAAIPEALRNAVLITLQLLVDRFDATEREALERTREWLLGGYRIRSL